MGQTVDGVPVVGDYDGDHKADFAVKEGNLWRIKESLSGYTFTQNWMDGSDLAVQNDYDGDGMVDIAVWRPSTGVWFIKQSSDFSTRSQQWGYQGDIPVPSLYRR